LYVSKSLVVQHKGVWLYNYRGYSCTTKTVEVVRLHGLPTTVSSFAH